VHWYIAVMKQAGNTKFNIVKHVDVELAQIFSCFDDDLVLLEKYSILFVDDTEAIKAKIGQYFEKIPSTQSLNINYGFLCIVVLCS